MEKEQLNIIINSIGLKEIISFIEINKIEYLKYRIACIKGKESNKEMGHHNE